MEDAPPLLDILLTRPGMLLGTKSLTALHHFVNGFNVACSEHQITDDRLGLDIPNSFHDWVAAKLGFRESTAGWCSMILSTSQSEEEAYDRFFEFLEEHAKENANEQFT